MSQALSWLQSEQNSLEHEHEVADCCLSRQGTDLELEDIGSFVVSHLAGGVQVLSWQADAQAGPLDRVAARVNLPKPVHSIHPTTCNPRYLLLACCRLQ